MPSVLVTGASGGFGRELVDVFRLAGWTVFPLVRDREVTKLWQGIDGCHAICADVGLPAVESAMAEVLGARGDSLDLLINNAGDVKKLRWLPATSAEDIEDLVRVHCVGAFRCTRAALPFLRRAANPTVINISSRFGSIARVAGGEFRGIYSYSVAKSAQNMLTACLDQELRKEGIRVFAVHPGRLKTPAGAVDADTDPRLAAERLMGWLRSVDRNTECALYDLMSGEVIPW